MTYFLLIVVGLIVGALLINRKAVFDLVKWARIKLGIFGRGALESERAGAAQQALDDDHHNCDAHEVKLADAVEKLKQSQGRKLSLDEMVADGTVKIARLDALVKKALRDNDRDQAGKFVKELQIERDSHQRNETDLAIATTAYDADVADVKMYRDELEAKKKDLENLGYQLKESERSAKLQTDLESLRTDLKFNKAGFGSERVVKDRINENRAGRIVYADLNADRIKRQKFEESIKAEETERLLSQYEADLNKSVVK